MHARAELLPRCLAATLWATLWASAGAHAREPDRLVELVSQGPWSAVSGLVAYRQRLWFVNGEKFVNHNAADLHSFDPRTGTSRYERHLFSQDAGDPSVIGGLLVWPFEDARFSTGRGEFAITDGQRWRWGWLPRQQVFHVHAAAAAGPDLYFATSAWSGGIQRSRDLGRTWDLLHVHPTPAGRVSRFTTLAVLDGTLYAGLTGRSQPGSKLFRLDTRTDGAAVAAVRGWPAGASARTAHAHHGWVYAVHHGADGSAVLRTDGEHVERVGALDGLDVRGFASGDRLWAVAAAPGGATVLASADGTRWSEVQRIPDAEPVSVALLAGDLYLGVRHAGGHGGLWGPPAPSLAGTPGPAPVAPALPDIPARRTEGDLEAELRDLDAALTDTRALEHYQGRLEAALTPILSRRSPEAGRALSERLSRRYPDAEIARFGGRVRIALSRSNRWHLLRAIALNGHGRVPPGLLAERWTSPANGAEKYLDPLPAAAWAIAWTGQDDAETLGALVARLGAQDLPAWANGDLVGALSALTGERFGHDLGAWRRWWAARMRATP